MRLRTFLVLVAGLSFFAAPKVSQAGAMTYLALGDSVAFGETDFTHNPSDGDRGYVSLFADYLATKDGGVSAERRESCHRRRKSTTSFTTGKLGRVPFLPGLTDASLASLNSNYAADPLATQSAQMQAEIAKQAAAGNTINNVSVSLGSDDLFAMALNPKFATLNATQQQATLLATLATIQSNYNAILTQIQTLLPHANIIVMGTYNPFTAAPGSPFAPLAGPAIAGLNQVLQGLAAAHGARYVDTASAFVGHEAAYTYITALSAGSMNVYNVHPNSLGYVAIEAQIQAVPEPSTVLLFGALGVGLCCNRYRRSRDQAKCGWLGDWAIQSQCLRMASPVYPRRALSCLPLSALRDLLEPPPFIIFRRIQVDQRSGLIHEPFEHVQRVHFEQGVHSDVSGKRADAEGARPGERDRVSTLAFTTGTTIRPRFSRVASRAHQPIRRPPRGRRARARTASGISPESERYRTRSRLRRACAAAAPRPQ